MNRDQLGSSPEPRQPIPDRFRRPPEPLRDPSVPHPGCCQPHRRADHLHRVTAPQQTHVGQEHMRRPAPRLPAAPAPWPQPPHPLQGPHRPPPRASPPAQNPPPAPRAHQPARGDIRLQARAIVCDDEQDRPSFRGIKGPLAKTRQGPTRGPNDNMTITIMSSATPPDQNPSSPSVSLTTPAVTTQRVAQQRTSGTTTQTDTSSQLNPGKSQGRPNEKPGLEAHRSKRPTRLRSPKEGPCPGSAETSTRTRQTLQPAVSCLEKEGRDRGSRS